jgi:hypothetical protein|tara:strand:- start:98 stop:262 length:165 start_codon:yes stop_codon:yes gene_type:complete
MSKQIITIVLETDIDSSTLLDIAQEFGHLMCEEIGTHGEEVVFLEDETCVETVQ